MAVRNRLFLAMPALMNFPLKAAAGPNLMKFLTGSSEPGFLSDNHLGLSVGKALSTSARSVSASAMSVSTWTPGTSMISP